MQFELFARWKQPLRHLKPDSLCVGSSQLPLQFVRNPRARRYILRLRQDGSVRVTIPRSGSISAGLEFAQRNSAWLRRQLQRRTEEQARRPRTWSDGSSVLFRGQPVCLSVRTEGELTLVTFADHTLCVPAGLADLRPAVEQYLWRLAEKELIPLTLQAAARHQLAVKRVTVRNQRSRWGSCSPRGTISLNWRLIQAPPLVRDYLIAHELMHLREMNHSARFWKWVEAACPEYQQAEGWLNAHNDLLH